MFPSSRSLLLSVSALLILTGCEEPEPAADQSSFLPTGVTDTSNLREVLSGLGESIPARSAAAPDGTLIDQGRALATAGRSPGSKDRRLSAYFYCLDCHSAEKPATLPAGITTPDAALAFAIEHDLPLLPGPDFAGLANRDLFFTGDIAAGYGAPGEGIPQLEAAVQFCNTTLAAGREITPPEMEALLAYLQSLEWKMADLGYRGADLAELKRRMLNPDEHAGIRSELKQRALPARTSTAGTLPQDPAAGYRIEGNPDPQTGKEIWSRSCLHCHGADGASEHYFGDKPGTWTKLAGAFASGDLYARLRRGGLPESATGARMPPFAAEKLNNAQIEHLRAYLAERSNQTVPETGANEDAVPGIGANGETEQE